jgi:hypothetical protein
MPSQTRLREGIPSGQARNTARGAPRPESNRQTKGSATLSVGGRPRAIRSLRHSTVAPKSIPSLCTFGLERRGQNSDAVASVIHNSR